MRILVIEDEGYVAELIRRALESMGNSCLVAPDAANAERLLDQHTVEAVTLDLGIPDQDGLDWLEMVASSRPDLARRTLVITGRVLGSRSIERLARCGAGMLAKPFTLANLEDAIRNQLDRPTYRRN
jgi:DNA-binding response OmpR family regulator